MSSMRSSNPVVGGGILSSLRPEVTMSSMRISNPGGRGILGSLRPKVTKSSMRSSNPGGRGILGLPRIGYSWDFKHKLFLPKLGPVSLYVWRLMIMSVYMFTGESESLCHHYP